MNTLTSNNIRSRFSVTSHAIGADSENVAFNVPRRAFKVLSDFLHGRNRSAKVRQWIAEGMQREDTWYGLAFRAAVGLKNFTQSIFTPAPPKEAADVFTAEVEALKVAIKHPERMTGGAKIAADAIAEFESEDNFIPKA